MAWYSNPIWTSIMKWKHIVPQLCCLGLFSILQIGLDGASGAINCADTLSSFYLKRRKIACIIINDIVVQNVVYSIFFVLMNFHFLVYRCWYHCWLYQVQGAVFDLPEEIAKDLLAMELPAGNTITKISKVIDIACSLSYSWPIYVMKNASWH